MLWRRFRYSTENFRKLARKESADWKGPCTWGLHGNLRTPGLREGEVGGNGGGETWPGMGGGAQESEAVSLFALWGFQMRGCSQVPGGAPPHLLFRLRRLERVSFILNARRLTCTIRLIDAFTT